jgi:hypothetical protein
MSTRNVRGVKGGWSASKAAKLTAFWAQSVQETSKPRRPPRSPTSYLHRSPCTVKLSHYPSLPFFICIVCFHLTAHLVPSVSIWPHLLLSKSFARQELGRNSDSRPILSSPSHRRSLVPFEAVKCPLPCPHAVASSLSNVIPHLSFHLKPSIQCIRNLGTPRRRRASPCGWKEVFLSLTKLALFFRIFGFLDFIYCKEL